MAKSLNYRGIKLTPKWSAPPTKRHLDSTDIMLIKQQVDRVLGKVPNLITFSNGKLKVDWPAFKTKIENDRNWGIDATGVLLYAGVLTEIQPGAWVAWGYAGFLYHTDIIRTPLMSYCFAEKRYLLEFLEAWEIKKCWTVQIHERILPEPPSPA